jgi:Ca-activated chloride channel family protein
MSQLNVTRRIPSTLIAALGALALSGSVRLEAQGAPIKTGVEMVPLTVTVTDASGRYVTGLSDSDFTVVEDGVQQPLAFFANDHVPLDVALVLDTSSSMRADLPLVQSAAVGLVRALRDSDRGAVVEVKGTAAIPQPFTSDRAQIESAIRSLSASGKTALFDGMYVVLKEFERQRRSNQEVRRQVLVLLSDGLDTQSRLAFEDVMDVARRVGVNIYVIALEGPSALLPRADRKSEQLRAEYNMGAIARESGGRTFFPTTARELPGIYTAIAQELASQYELGYIPVRPGGDGAFRRVMVRIAPAANALARTRSGYYAQRSPGGM